MSEEEKKSGFAQAVMESMSTETPSKEVSEEKETTTSEDDLKGFNEEQKTNWKALRESKKDIEKRYKESEATKSDLLAQMDGLKAELDSAKKTFDVEEFQRVKSEREDLVNQVAELDILRSPEVKEAQEKSSSEVKHALQAIRRALPESGGLEKILSLDLESRDASMTRLLQDNDADTRTATRVWSLLDQVDKSQRQVDSLTENAQSRVEEWKQGKQTKADQAKQNSQKRAQDLFIQGLQAAQDPDTGFPELFVEQDGDEFQDRNQLVRDTINFARKVVTEPHTEQEFAEIGFLAGVGKNSVTTNKLQLEVIAKLKAELDTALAKNKAFESAQPGGSESFSDSGDSSVDRGHFAKAVMAHMGT